MKPYRVKMTMSPLLKLKRINPLVFGTMLFMSASTHASKPVMSEAQMLPQYRQECSSCHIAYPPELMSKAAWGRVMTNLAQHYGTDASLDPQTIQEITQWLQQYGGSYKRAVNTSKEDRLTTTPWFIRKHSEIKPDTYQRASIKSPSHCGACHTSVSRGDFEENFVRIPK